MLKGMWNGLKSAFGNAFAFFAKGTKAYKGATTAAAKRMISVAAKTRGEQAASAFALAVGTPIVGLLGFWGWKKTEESTQIVGFLALVAGLTAIGTGAFILATRKGR